MRRDILIVGASGQQGKATIDALYQSKKLSLAQFRILALTRSTSSSKAQALKSTYPDIILVQGDTQAPEAIFKAYPSISSVFLVTVPPDDEAQAFPLIQAAVSSPQFDHFVFSSVDRGGDTVSWSQPTQVPHFAAKHRVELYLRQACSDASKRWTVLRPTGFMDSYNPGFFGQLMVSLWAAGMPADRKMQMVSTHDIGIFAAKALLDPEGWAGRAVALAGDELSLTELRHAFQWAVGKTLPETYKVVAYPVLWMVADAAKSFEWFSTEGWDADITGLREEVPELQDFETWLRESSKWECVDSGR
ncbi:unnamed protein product [Clonostachys byssicola]|uniref:NmrA-like domain-containing protein n=1 Tax=Clonostachys byssicola TaxID=160290 RepID=A0A9N9U280_9HYPO|nr:unnamed protein product [Clonostachys byssicola]